MRGCVEREGDLGTGNWWNFLNARDEEGGERGHGNGRNDSKASEEVQNHKVDVERFGATEGRMECVEMR